MFVQRTRTRLWIGLVVFLFPLATSASETMARVRSGRAIRWSVCRSANFFVCTTAGGEAANAQAIECESLRRRLLETWYPIDAHRAPFACDWTPICQVVYHPTWESYAAATGDRDRTTSGATTLTHDGKSVATRRIDLCPDAARAAAALAHEMTHVIMYDRYATSVLPRWLDEGVAGSMDPDSKRARFAARLRERCRAGQRLDLLALFASIDYPSRDVETFYAQSLLVVEHLIAEHGAERFLAFADSVAQVGAESALRRNYSGMTLAELERALQIRLTRP